MAQRIAETLQSLPWLVWEHDESLQGFVMRAYGKGDALTAIRLNRRSMWAPTQLERQFILMLLARNVPRMQLGYEEVARHVKTDEAGRQFIEAFMNWSREVLQRGQAELEANGYGAQ
jgi:hypothetical protein